MKQGHWYDPQTGEARHYINKSSGPGSRATTIADARKHGWYPGVTNIINVLEKPALIEWMIRQAVMAVVTSPDKPGESIDDKVTRVLDIESQQDAESIQAADRGKVIHEAVENALAGRDFGTQYLKEIEAVVNQIRAMGRVICTEKIVIGEGYGGRMDVMLDNESLGCVLVIDIKTSKKLPDKGSWIEHRLQTAAYAKAEARNLGDRRILTANIYVSTTEPGKIALHTQDDWISTYENGFVPLLRYWQWSKGFYVKAIK